MIGRLELYFHTDGECACHGVFGFASLVVSASFHLRVKGIEAGDSQRVQSIDIEPDAVHVVAKYSQVLSVEGISQCDVADTQEACILIIDVGATAGWSESYRLS